MTPPLVEEMAAAGAAAGFGLSCEPEVGRLLAVLAAAVPPGGAVLELGTGQVSDWPGPSPGSVGAPMSP